MEIFHTIDAILSLLMGVFLGGQEYGLFREFSLFREFDLFGSMNLAFLVP